MYIQRGLKHEPEEIALAVDARFNFGNDRDVLVRNHRHQAWGKEERYTPFFPFSPGIPFEMVFLVEPYCFKVLVKQYMFMF